MEDKYKTLTAPELAAEDAFIRWVLKGENDDRWISWQNNNPETAGAIAEAKQLISSISFTGDSINAYEKNELWARINSSIHQPARNVSQKRFSFARWSIAAAAMIAILIWAGTAKNTEKVIALSGEKKEIALPESSHVILNAGSEIAYQEKNFSNSRKLTLDGEAYFQVEPGSKFTVCTDRGDITVLGTSFNVISRPGRFEVSCYSGKVSVSNNKSENQIITAGERVVEESSQLKKDTFTPSDKPGWTHGKFTFDNQPLSIVKEELERQFKVKVELPKELMDIRYTGFFELGNLETALYSITWPLHLTYEIRGNTVTISK